MANPDSGRPRRPAQEQVKGKAMADQEMKAANETYAGFVGLFKTSAIITAVVALVVVLLIS